MLRTTPQIFGSLFACSVMISSVIVSFNYAFHNVTPSSLAQKSVITENKTDKRLKFENVKLNETIVDLRDTIQELRGTVSFLQKENARLNKQISVLNNLMNTQRISLEEAQKEMSKMTKEMTLLQSELQKMQNGKDVNQIEVKGLMAEIESLNQKMDEERRTTNMALSKIEMLNREKDKTEKEVAEYKKAKSIQQTTSVNFKKLVARNEKFSKDLKKIDKKNKKWNFTSIELELENANESLILGKRFHLMIIDPKTKKPLPIQEVNPDFPDSNTNNEQMSFIYDGNLVELYHSNYEVKEGQDYDVAVFFELNGDLGMLAGGSVPFIKDGEIVFKPQ